MGLTAQQLNSSTASLLSSRKRIAATSLILLSTLLALTYLLLQLKARLHYHFGGDAMEAKEYAEAVQHYEKATQGQPKDARMVKALGNALHALSQEKPIQEAYALEKRAMAAFEDAAQLIPIDAEARYGQARSLARLEQMHPFVHPDDAGNPYTPLPAFHKAIELRPNGILYRYALVRYLYRTGDIRNFYSEIQELVRIYPLTYDHLKKEPFWSPPLEPVAEQGLQRAVEAGTMPRAALMALADIHERTGEPLEAVRLYSLALQETPRKNPSHHIHLGRLLLDAGKPQQAEEAFMLGLTESTSREAYLSRVFSIFKAHNRAGAFPEFFDRADSSIPFSFEARLVTARALMETGALIEARHLLGRLNRRRPTAEAYYLLYTIASKQKDPDRMELAIQKATVLDPRNSRYHHLFSRVLVQAGKLDLAEQAATQALEQADKPSARLLHTRALIRRRQNDLSGALADWNKAMAPPPGKAAYHAYAAEILVQLARLDEALAHAAKATALEPKNARYRKLHMQLQQQLKQT